MAEGESSDDLQTLIRPDDLEGIQEENESNPPSMTALLQPSAPSWMLPLQCAALVTVTTSLVVTLPPYLEAVNISGDAYSALIFISVFSTIPIVLYVQLRYSYFCQFVRLGPPNPACVLKCGMFYGLSGLMIFYSLDRKRVVCHAQEPLMGLIVMYMIIIYFFYKGPELISGKMFCLCGVLCGIFLAMDFQLNNVYLCRGVTRMEASDDGGDWTGQTHALWTIVYTAALFLFTWTWLMLEKEIMTKRCGSGGLSLVATVSGGLPAPGSDSESLIVGSSHTGQGTIPAKWGIYMVWFTLASLTTIVLMFWTDFFPALGKGTSSSFVNLTSSGLACHFRWDSSDCGPTAMYGWIFTILHIAFLLLLGQVVSSSGSMIYALSVSSVSLPLTALWWSLFRMGGSLGIEWHPQVTGELIFSLLGLPLMVFCLAFWAHLDKQDKLRSNNFQLCSSTNS